MTLKTRSWNLFLKVTAVSCLLTASFAFAKTSEQTKEKATQQATAQNGREYAVDPTHSRIGFVVRHLVSKVPGNFNEFEGTFNFDPKHPEKSKVSAKISAESVNTDNKKRDDHLRSDDFFAAQKHPTITFESTKIVPSKKGHYKMDGNLTLLGVTKPVSFDVEYLGEAQNPFGPGQRAGFTAVAEINRKDFGMKWNKALDNGGMVLSDTVEIQLNIEALEKTAAQM